MSVWKIFAVSLLFCFQLHADVTEYRQVYEEANRDFYARVSGMIKKELSSRTEDEREIYAVNRYRPIWFDQEGLTPNTYRFIDLLEEDEGLSKNPNLKATYDGLMAEYRAGEMHGLPLDEKVRRELKVTRLYLDYIGGILEGKGSKFNAKSLLIYSLRLGSLVFGFNAIVRERLAQQKVTLKRAGSLVPNGTGLEKKIKEKLAGIPKNGWLREIYGMLDYRPVWIGRGAYPDRTHTLLKMIEKDPTLDPGGIIVREMEKISKFPVPADDDTVIERELRVMALYHLYAKHHLFGSIDWKAFDNKLKRYHPKGVWIPHQVLASPVTLLVTALGRDTLEEMFTYSRPPFVIYEKMLAALKKYRKIEAQGGWKRIEASETLRPGKSYAVVPQLRERLAVEGDYDSSLKTNASIKYDATLVEAVKRFQKRHGLSDDGIVGKRTWEMLNIPVEEKIAKMVLNLDRIKWFKRGKERYHIIVNIPSFMLYLYEGMEPMERMRVVVGKKKHETPIFYNRIKRITLNPYWRIPTSIIKNEMVPKLIADPDYTLKKHIEIHKGPSVESPLVDPHSIDWKKYRGKVPPYYFMQSPGSFNALGKIKYLFPNEYAVYMHDTPAKALFHRDYRAFSHGCIRLARPVDLLEKYAAIDPDIDFDEARKILDENRHTRLYPKLQIPIDTVYLTTWVTRDGIVEFREDLYGYDTLQMGR